MRLRLGLLALAVAAIAAVPALAAPDKTGTLSGDAPKFEWTGGPGNGSGAAAVAQEAEEDPCLVTDCEYILLDVQAKGNLTVTLNIDDAQNLPIPVFEGGLTIPDIDVYPYKSNAAGEPEGDPLTTDAATGAPVETFTLNGLAAGKYVLKIVYFLGAEATYSATAELKGAAPSAPPAGDPTPTPSAEPTPAPTGEPTPAPQPQSNPSPPPSAQPTPAATPAPKPASSTKTAAAKRKAAVAKCKKKAKKIKNAKKRKKALKRCAKKR